MAVDQWTTLIVNLPAAAANAPSHTEHSHLQSSVQITLHDCQPATGWGDRLPMICRSVNASQQDGSTIALSENYRSETIGRSDCRPTVRLSADTIVRWDYRPNPNTHSVKWHAHVKWNWNKTEIKWFCSVLSQFHFSASHIWNKTKTISQRAWPIALSIKHLSTRRMMMISCV